MRISSVDFKSVVDRSFQFPRSTQTSACGVCSARTSGRISQRSRCQSAWTNRSTLSRFESRFNLICSWSKHNDIWLKNNMMKYDYGKMENVMIWGRFRRHPEAEKNSMNSFYYLYYNYGYLIVKTSFENVRINDFFISFRGRSPIIDEV